MQRPPPGSPTPAVTPKSGRDVSTGPATGPRLRSILPGV